ncbi:response regulator transcription factor [Geobacter sp.]|uniref:response regulator transcription factor n=1 Tax=Geobacter sp. TaxID=46610 RepID=UPI002621EFD4|nr:response regulator [Geobacter sp.]
MGSRLLLADDSITIQKVVGIIFANEDYELTVVDNGDAAVEKAREVRPDVMLVDAVMPGKSGYEVCAAVRRDPLLKDVPILLMTGAFEPFDEEKARESGADDFISKPFESQQLVDRVKSLMALRASRPEAPAAEAAPEAPGEELFTLDLETPLPVPEEPVAPVTPFAEPLFETPAAPESAFFAELEEVSPADDLWGAFELVEEVVEEEAGGGVETEVGIEASLPAPGPIGEVSSGAPAVAPAGTVEFGIPAEEEFVFGVEEEPAAPSSPAVEQFEALSVDTFSFESVSAPPAEPFAFGMEEAAAPAAEEPAGGEAFVPLFGEPALPEVEQQVAPEEEYVPAAEAIASPAAAAPSGPAEAPGGTITLTEEQLSAAISRISREIIERIAWEVVPDLAETLIKEEIRKIKEGS